VRASWHAALRSRRFRALALLVAPALVLALFGFRIFLEFVEARSGAVLNDPLLSLIPSHDVARMLFFLVYGTMFGGVITLISHPYRLITAVWAYVFVLMIRAAVMYLLPLDPPAGLIPMNDALMELSGTHLPPTRDLFFSGHTATLFLFVLALRTLRLRLLALVATLLVATGVLVQHAHYAADVLAAPFFSYACYRAATGLVQGTTRGRDAHDG